MPRTLLKTMTYTAMHFVVAFGVAFALTGSWIAAAGIGLVEPLVQTVAYAFHERAWQGRGDGGPRGRPLHASSAI